VLVGDRLLVHFDPLACLDAATGMKQSRDRKGAVLLALAIHGTAPLRSRLGSSDRAKATYGTPAPASSGFCLANVAAKGAEFLVYLPRGPEVAVDLSGVPGRAVVDRLAVVTFSRRRYGDEQYRGRTGRG
jgi:hypothetical protein